MLSRTVPVSLCRDISSHLAIWRDTQNILIWSWVRKNKTPHLYSRVGGSDPGLNSTSHIYQASFLHLRNLVLLFVKQGYNIYLLGLLWGLNEMLSVKCLGQAWHTICAKQIVAEIMKLTLFCKNCMSVYNLQASPGLNESVGKNLNF